MSSILLESFESSSLSGLLQWQYKPDNVGANTYYSDTVFSRVAALTEGSYAWQFSHSTITNVSGMYRQMRVDTYNDSNSLEWNRANTAVNLNDFDTLDIDLNVITLDSGVLLSFGIVDETGSDPIGAPFITTTGAKHISYDLAAARASGVDLTYCWFSLRAFMFIGGTNKSCVVAVDKLTAFSGNTQNISVTPYSATYNPVIFSKRKNFPVSSAGFSANYPAVVVQRIISFVIGALSFATGGNSIGFSKSNVLKLTVSAVSYTAVTVNLIKGKVIQVATQAFTMTSNLLLKKSWKLVLSAASTSMTSALVLARNRIFTVGTRAHTLSFPAFLIKRKRALAISTMTLTILFFSFLRNWPWMRKVVVVISNFYRNKSH